MFRSPLGLALLSVCVACGPLSPPKTDAGTGGGGGGDVGGGSGGGAMGGGTGGGGTGGGAMGGGGGAMGGGTGGGATGGGTGGGATGGGGGQADFTWTTMGFNPAPTAPTQYSVKGLARRANGEVWVSLSNGELFHSAGGDAFTSRVPNVPAQTTGSELGPLAAIGDDLVLARGAKLHFCTGPCANFANFTEVKSLPFPETTGALCAGNGKVYVVSNSGTVGRLSSVDQGTGTWTSLSMDLGVGTAWKCHVDASGDVFVAGDRDLAVLHNGGFHTELVDATALSVNHGLRDVATSGTAGFAVGTASGPMFARRQGTSWIAAPALTGGTLFTSVAMLSDSEALAGVIVNGSSTAPGIWRWTGSTFTPLAPPAPVFEVEHALRVSANDVYFAGYGRSTGGYVVAHGTR